jgi:hypothetical protein
LEVGIEGTASGTLVILREKRESGEKGIRRKKLEEVEDRIHLDEEVFDEGKVAVAEVADTDLDGRRRDVSEVESIAAGGD